MTITSILAVDPGNMTGLAHFNVLWSEPETRELPALEATQLCDSILLARKGILVVCESFIPRPGAGTWQPDAMYTIGAVRYLALKHDAEGFELQSPADAKRFSTDAKLKTLGWFTPTPDGHANDALRHLLLGLVRHNKIDPRRLTDEPG